MSQQIRESDWKIFRDIAKVALERFCERTLGEITAVAIATSRGAHERYLEVFKLIDRRDGEIALAFNDLRRSNAIVKLAAMRSRGVVTDEEFQRAESVARIRHQRVEDVLADLLERAVEELPVDLLPDEDVLALAEMTLDGDQEEELGGLLARNREGALDDESRTKLDELMRVYEHGLLRKAQALREAVRRGLREPLVA
jgi:hypothetical protein